MKAMIFAAGFGKRLQPLTFETPKALVTVKNRPILEWVVDKLVQHGISEIIINTHYLHSKIHSYLRTNSFPIPITISHEEAILGTGSGLYHTRQFWDDSDFFVCNVDILCDVDLHKFFKFHESHNTIVTLGVNDHLSKSMLLVDEAGFLVGRSIAGQQQLLKKPLGKTFEVGFCGFHAISPGFFAKVKPPMSFSIIDDYMNMLKTGASIMTWSIGDAYWEDIGTAEALNRANREFPG